MDARPGAPLRELRYEETTWKARPDWSPDGKRVVYSSYLGRAMESTVADDEQWRRSFSPHLWRIRRDRAALVARRQAHRVRLQRGRQLRRSGSSRCRAAKKQRVDARERHYRGAVGTLRIDVVDRNGQAIVARLSVTAADGRGYVPDDAWRHADEAFRSHRAGCTSTPTSIQAGRALLTVPAGQLHIEAWRGPEYRLARVDVTVPAGGRVARRIVLERLDNLPAPRLVER